MAVNSRVLKHLVLGSFFGTNLRSEPGSTSWWIRALYSALQQGTMSLLLQVGRRQHPTLLLGLERTHRWCVGKSSIPKFALVTFDLIFFSLRIRA
jgi:hypothetical protein